MVFSVLPGVFSDLNRLSRVQSRACPSAATSDVGPGGQAGSSELIWSHAMRASMTRAETRRVVSRALQISSSMGFLLASQAAGDGPDPLPRSGLEEFDYVA